MRACALGRITAKEKHVGFMGALGGCAVGVNKMAGKVV